MRRYVCAPAPIKSRTAAAVVNHATRESIKVILNTSFEDGPSHFPSELVRTAFTWVEPEVITV
jgi:hypothetical protein